MNQESNANARYAAWWNRMSSKISIRYLPIIKYSYSYRSYRNYQSYPTEQTQHDVIKYSAKPSAQPIIILAGISCLRVCMLSHWRPHLLVISYYLSFTYRCVIDGYLLERAAAQNQLQLHPATYSQFISAALELFSTCRVVCSSELEGIVG